MPHHLSAAAENQPRVTVVIPHRNATELLAECLRSVESQALAGGLTEIIVVDNGSTVSLEPVRAAFPTVQFLSELKPGPGHARNRGAEAARAPLLAFIDADCRAAPGWLQSAVDRVESDIEHAIIGGDVRIALADPIQIHPVEAFEIVFGFRQDMYIKKHSFSVTANLATSKRVWNLIGPFGGIEVAEDRDWGRRAKSLGYPTQYEPGMVVYHPARASLNALRVKWQRLIQHDYNEHLASKRPLWRWHTKILAVLASIPFHGVKLLVTPRLSGLRSRVMGLGVLLTIRLFRAREMLTVGFERRERKMSWNQ